MRNCGSFVLGFAIGAAIIILTKDKAVTPPRPAPPIFPPCPWEDPPKKPEKRKNCYYVYTEKIC